MQTVQVGHAPLVGTTAAVSAFVWLLGLAYLYAELTTDERAMGVLVTALLALLYVIPALDPGVSPRPAVLQSPLFTIHVLAMLFVRELCAGGCARGDIRVVQGNQGQASWILLRAAALAAGPRRHERPCRHDRLIFLTIGITVGGIWASQVQGSADPRAQAMSAVDPKILVALVCWAVYSFALFARRAIGGRAAGRPGCRRSAS